MDIASYRTKFISIQAVVKKWSDDLLLSPKTRAQTPRAHKGKKLFRNLL